MGWISHPLELHGSLVSLLPLRESHFLELVQLAKDKRIWEHYTIDASDTDKMKNTLKVALNERDNGTQYPFIIWKKDEKKVIGATRLLDINPDHKKLEVGWTWLHPDYWGTTVNIECKFLLLKYCFEELCALRVQLKTDENNIRSRKAIAKIGGLFEGVFRNDMIRDNGTKRNSAYFSIIDTEWDNVKGKLVTMLAKTGEQP
jgi:N-acetyltransferase